jgi:hypothetical protein
MGSLLAAWGCIEQNHGVHKGILILAFSLLGVGASPIAFAATCSTVPDNTYNFVKSQMIGKIKRSKLTLAKARELPWEYSKFLGMMLEESGGDAAKVAIHGKEDDKGNYSKIKDWVYEENIVSSVSEVESNIATFLSRTNYQTNFGISQISPDQGAYNGDNHKFVRARLAEIQALAKSDPDAAIKRCGTDILFKDSNENLRAAFAKMSKCNPNLELKVTKTSTTPINDNARLSCFARIAMLCPGMHFDIMAVYPKSNWGTKDAKRKCVSALEQEVEDYFKGGSSSAPKATPVKEHN